MTRKELVSNIVNNCGFPHYQAKKAVDSFFEGLKEALIKEERIEMRGFGVFTVKKRMPKVGCNLNTGARVDVPAGKVVKFKPGKDLRTIK